MGDSMSWFIGKVVSVKDPHESGRVQVRIYGKQDDTVNIPDERLPWALVMQSPTSAAIGKIGTAPVGLTKDSTVIGFWADADRQYPVIMGSIGKAGDPIPDQVENGAPAVNTAFGSIPSAAQASTPHPYNPYSNLFQSKVSIRDVDAGDVSIFSVNNTTGSVITKDIEQGMQHAKTPTIAYNAPGNTKGIFDLLVEIDPSSRNAAIPCLPKQMLLFNNLIGAGMNFASGLIGVVVKAVKNAVLNIAKQIGLFKVLNILNATASLMANVYGVMKSLTNIQLGGGCGPSALNNGSANPGEIALGTVIQGLNTATGYVHNVSKSISATVSSAVLLTTMVAPKSNKPTTSSAKPASDLIVTTPPPTYTQNYHLHDVDPYPGYIEWDDPTNPGKMVYTLRNGQPNYTSPTEHTQFSVENSFTNQIKTGITSLTGQFMSSVMQQTMAFAQNFALSTVMGVGILLNPTAFISNITANIEGLFSGVQNFISGSFYQSTNLDPISIAKTILSLDKMKTSLLSSVTFQMNQATMSAKKQAMKTALTKTY
jgi:hypothetical protein